MVYTDNRVAASSVALAEISHNHLLVALLAAAMAVCSDSKAVPGDVSNLPRRPPNNKYVDTSNLFHHFYTMYLGVPMYVLVLMGMFDQ